MRALDLIEVPLKDGTVLRMCADINALCLFERELVRVGFDPVRELARIERGAGGTITGLRALIWAAACNHHAGLTVDHVGELLQSDGPALRDGLLQALAAAQPDSDPDSPEDPATGKTVPPSA